MTQDTVCYVRAPFAATKPHQSADTRLETVKLSGGKAASLIKIISLLFDRILVLGVVSLDRSPQFLLLQLSLMLLEV